MDARENQGLDRVAPAGHEQMKDFWWKSFGLRFLGIYLVLFVMPFPFYYAPGPPSAWVSSLVAKFWDALVFYTGNHILPISYEVAIRPSGSGDTTYNYIQLLLILLISSAGAVLWVGWRRRDRADAFLGKWLPVVVRYYLAATMLGYGFGKVFKAQFPFPSLERLLVPTGEFSPMGLVWRFMGYSSAYNVFTGLGEVVGGCLLFFRRTTTLGALILVGVMGNVVVLNYAYDIPVKIFSTHLLLLAIGLVLRDARSLLNMLLLNRPSAARDLGQAFAGKAKLPMAAVKVLFVGYLIAVSAWVGYSNERRWGDKREKPALYGIWDIEEFTWQGELLPPLLTDHRRWRHLVIDFEGRASISSMAGEFTRHAFSVDEEAGTISFGAAQSEERAEWSFSQPSEEELLIEGSFEDQAFSLQARRRDLQSLLLVNRGFHWINERPLNR